MHGEAGEGGERVMEARGDKGGNLGRFLKEEIRGERSLKEEIQGERSLKEADVSSAMISPAVKRWISFFCRFPSVI